MESFEIISSEGAKVGTMSVPKFITETKVSGSAIHSVVRWQRAKARSGTHSVLTRSNIQGGKKKPWKQKGTGNARAGSSVSPLWVGGAVVHGPTPRSYEFSLNKKLKHQALVSAFAAMSRDGKVVVLESLTSKTGKTKEFAAMLGKLKLTDKKLLLVVDSGDAAVARASRNIPRVISISSQGLNVFDLLNADQIVFSKDSMESFLKRLEPRKAD